LDGFGQELSTREIWKSVHGVFGRMEWGLYTNVVRCVGIIIL
jgi:hypothetical protein